jgi:hypothetical protein
MPLDEGLPLIVQLFQSGLMIVEAFHESGVGSRETLQSFSRCAEFPDVKLPE